MCFFNLPYASRLLLQALETVPAEQHKLCAHLGMSHWNKFKWVEWPRIRQQLPHVIGLVFMLCFTSFATVMALGGGPKSTTIELAIYQAIKFDFDLQSGALLAIWQIILCGTLSFSIQRLAKPVSVSTGSSNASVRMVQDNWPAKCWDWSWIALVCLFVLPPLFMVVVSGLNSDIGKVLSDSSFWLSLFASLKVAILAAMIALAAGVAILTSSRAWRLRHKHIQADQIELIGTIILVTPGLVTSTGLFLLIRSFADAFSYALLVVVLVNALMLCHTSSKRYLSLCCILLSNTSYFAQA